MFVATLDTRNFSFIAFGRTFAEANEMMCRGWGEHMAQTGATMKWRDVCDDVIIREVQPGQCWRDDYLLHTVTLLDRK